MPTVQEYFDHIEPWAQAQESLIKAAAAADAIAVGVATSEKAVYLAACRTLVEGISQCVSACGDDMSQVARAMYPSVIDAWASAADQCHDAPMTLSAYVESAEQWPLKISRALRSILERTHDRW